MLVLAPASPPTPCICSVQYDVSMCVRSNSAIAGRRVSRWVLLITTLLFLVVSQPPDWLGRQTQQLPVSREPDWSSGLRSTAALLRVSSWLPRVALAEAAQSYYTVLGVSRDATEREIKRAYLKLAKRYHPDKNRGDKKAERKFRLIARAYEVLSDTEKRRVYDQLGEEGLRQQEQGGSQTGPYQGQSGQFQQFFFPGGGPFGHQHGSNFRFSFQDNGGRAGGAFDTGFPFEDLFNEFMGSNPGGSRQRRTFQQRRRPGGYQRCEETKICSNGRCQTRITCSTI